MLTIENLSFAYRKGHPVIRNLSLEIEKGTVCGLLGSNGSGKSTLFYLICGLLKPASGSILYNGYIPRDRDTAFLEDVFIVPEEVALPNVRFRDYVAVNAPFYPRFSAEQMEMYISLFNIEPNVHLAKCSMGQRKKAFLSFALACNTSLLLLDEPTNGLDISSKQDFRKAISLCMNDDKAVVISTHQVHDIDKILDHVVILGEEGVALNQSIPAIMEKLSFSFSSDGERIHKALIALDAPGGANIVELNQDPDSETEVNLESLYELFTRNPSLGKSLFNE